MGGEIDGMETWRGYSRNRKLGNHTENAKIKSGGGTRTGAPRCHRRRGTALETNKC